MKLRHCLMFLFSALTISAAPSAFADSQFNQDLQQFLECKKTLKNYYDLGFEFEDDLKKNGWIKQGEEYSYVSKVPITVFSQTTDQISLVSGGMLAVLKHANTKDLAKKFQITQNPFFKDMPYFSGEKVVKTDLETKETEKSLRKLTLAESNPVVDQGEHKTYIGCVYITEFEQQQQDAAIKALQ